MAKECVGTTASSVADATTKAHTQKAALRHTLCKELRMTRPHVGNHVRKSETTRRHGSPLGSRCHDESTRTNKAALRHTLCKELRMIRPHAGNHVRKSETTRRHGSHLGSRRLGGKRCKGRLCEESFDRW